MQLSIEEKREIGEVLQEYGFAKKSSRMTRNTVGLVNDTFMVECDNIKYVLRRLNRNIALSQLAFEVEVLRYLETRKYELSPRIVLNSRKEYLTYHDGYTYMLQSFISGETLATMDNIGRFNGNSLKKFFGAIAVFSKITHDFTPAGAYPRHALSEYPRMVPMFLKDVDGHLPACAKSDFEKHKRDLIDFSSKVLAELVALDYDNLPKQLVHFDFHPGNVRYRGEEIVGIFDYDTARFDCRLSELAAAIAMSCHSRRGGALLRRKVKEGVAAYRAVYGPSEFDRNLENHLLTAATEACVLAQTLWAIDWYCENYQRDNAQTVLGHWLNLCARNCGSLFADSA